MMQPLHPVSYTHLSIFLQNKRRCVIGTHLLKYSLPVCQAWHKALIAKHQAVAVGVYHYGLLTIDLLCENFLRQLVEHVLLDGALHWACEMCIRDRCRTLTLCNWP